MKKKADGNGEVLQSPEDARKVRWLQLPQIRKDVDTFYIPATENLGSFIRNRENGSIRIGDAGADAQVVLERGVLVTNAVPDVISEEMTDLLTEIFGPGTCHDNDYSFYYNNIKENVAKRIAAYKRTDRKERMVRKAKHDRTSDSSVLR